MKVLIYNEAPTAPLYIRMGLCHGFNQLGHNAVLWNAQTKSVFDAFNEFEPDLFIGQTYNINRAMYKCIVTRPHLKVLLFGSCWGPLINEIDLEKYPIVVVNDEEKRVIEQLKKETGQPEFVYIHYHNSWIEPTMGGWYTLGITPVGIMNAFDTDVYSDGEFCEELKSDVMFIGGKWGYKSRTLDRYLLPMCHPSFKQSIPTDRFVFRIFGNQSWPTHNFCGFLDEQLVKHAIVSATVCPNVSEPHSQDYGFDIIERPFKIMGAGGFLITDYVKSMAEDVFNQGECEYASSPDEMHEKIRHYIKHPDERQKFIEKGKSSVLTGHTYIHRAQQILNLYGES